MLNIKYRVHEVAKDFDRNSKEIVDILTQYATAPKNHMQVDMCGQCLATLPLGSCKNSRN